MKEKIKNEGFYDEVGGYHDCGIGWSPKGTWCGECTFASCKYCPNVIKEKREEENEMKDILELVGKIEELLKKSKFEWFMSYDPTEKSWSFQIKEK